MLLTLLLFSAQNLVINGDFENTSSAGCEFNLPNATFNARMAACNAYGNLLGAGEIDIMVNNCGYGGDGPVGARKIALACDSGAEIDAFTIQLSTPLVAGKAYTLTAWLYGHIDFFSTQALPLNVGVSNSSGSTGTSVGTLHPNTAGFAQVTLNFTAPLAGTYLSFEATPFTDGWTHLDGIELTSAFSLAQSGTCPGPVTLTATGATPNGSVVILYGNAGSRTKPSGVCAGTTVGIGNPTVGAIRTANGAGTATLSFQAPAGACGKTVQAVDLQSCAVSNTILL